MSMLYNQQVFVETSIQVARLLGTQNQRTSIEQTLQQSQFNFVTSHYVYMEYQRTVISDFAHVHQSFQRAKTMGEAMQLIFSGSRSFRPRSLVRCGQIASLIYGEQEVVSLREATALLDLYLKRLLSRIFWHYLQPIEDRIHCDLNQSGTQQLPDQTFRVADRCRKEMAGCALPEFLAKNQSRLQFLAAFLSENPRSIKDQTRVEQTLVAVLRDSANALGQVACWPLGDIIIALQVPMDALLWTQDHDFATLCSALNIERFVLPDTS